MVKANSFEFSWLSNGLLGYYLKVYHYMCTSSTDGRFTLEALEL